MCLCSHICKTMNELCMSVPLSGMEACRDLACAVSVQSLPYRCYTSRDMIACTSQADII